MPRALREGLGTLGIWELGCLLPCGEGRRVFGDHGSLLNCDHRGSPRVLMAVGGNLSWAERGAPVERESRLPLSMLPLSLLQVLAQKGSSLFLYCPLQGPICSSSVTQGAALD